MNTSLLWRGILIIALLAVALWSALPLKEKIKLGLDLRGGMHLVLAVNVDDALKAETERDMQRVIDLAADEDIQLTGERLSNTRFQVSGFGAGEPAKIQDDLRNELGNTWDWTYSGGTMSFDMTAANADQIRNLSVEQSLQTIRNRVDAYGVAEPVIQRVGMGENRIVVQLPGVEDPERVRNLIKSTAFLEFRLVAKDFPQSGMDSREAVLAHFGGTLPKDLEIFEQLVQDPDTGELMGRRYYALEKRQVITGRDVRNARPGQGQFNEPVVLFSLTRDGGKRFGEVTGANVGRPLAIVLDQHVISAPTINSRINDNGQIEGNFTYEEVQDLSTKLRSGALPASITYLEERTVGPSLGRDSIEQGLRAGIIGFALVILSMLVVYKGAGVNAVTALLLNIIFVFGALAYFHATLTLPGIAGIILTIGMAVDANVLIFERIREELRVGRTVKSAVDAGFGKALSSILDANITTLIAALFLFQFGTGPIRGFAVTLSVGILASVFTAVVVSRWIFDLVLSRRQRVEKLSI
jgi:preprotein translocase subunit SecD